MRVEKCSAGSAWYARVQLEDDKWPSIDENDEWLQRSIRQWVLSQCAGNTWFTCAGLILFESKEDLMMFQLTWG